MRTLDLSGARPLRGPAPLAGSGTARSCLCRRHHRLKTFAPGWRFVLTPDGRLRVTTPSGVTRTTRPPGLRDRIEQRALPAPPPPPVEPPPF